MYIFIHEFFFRLISECFRWQKDPQCDGVFPKTFDEVKKTLQNIRKVKYGNAPINGQQILEAFQQQQIRENLGYSILEDHGPLFNDVIISDKFENCIFSSAKSIQLIIQNIPESKRFFILDGTFYITPKGVWQQVVVLHANFQSKVKLIFILKKTDVGALNVGILKISEFFTIFPACIHLNVKTNDCRV